MPALDPPLLSHPDAKQFDEKIDPSFFAKKIVTSPYRRAYNTAVALQQQSNRVARDAEIECDLLLGEFLGNQTCPLTESMFDPDTIVRAGGLGNLPPSRESNKSLAARAKQFLEKIRQSSNDQVVVTHGVVIQFIARALGIQLFYPPTFGGLVIRVCPDGQISSFEFLQ